MHTCEETELLCGKQVRGEAGKQEVPAQLTGASVPDGKQRGCAAGAGHLPGCWLWPFPQEHRLDGSADFTSEDLDCCSCVSLTRVDKRTVSRKSL